MSQDLKLKHKCPHYVVEEWLALEQDRQTLYFQQNPSSSQVKLLWNRQEVPKQGLYSSVEVTSLIPEPYEIETGDNDVFAISVSGGSTQQVTLPVGRKVKTRNIVAALNEELEGVTASEVRGRVHLRADRQGPDVSLKLEGGSAHETLGFEELRFYQTRTLIPGWSLVRRQDDEDPNARKLVFNEPLPVLDDIFEVSYYTRRQVCRRCMALGIENDLKHSQDGQPVLAENQTLLLQEVEKIIFTIRGSHPFHEWYGTSILDLIGNKIVGGGQIVEARLAAEISNAISRYRQIKEEQSRYQPVSDAEFLQQVTEINVEQDSSDPTIFYVSIGLRSRSGEIEQVEDTLMVSGASFAENFQFIR